MKLCNAIPKPKFAIGDTVKLAFDKDRAYYLRRHLKACIRAWRNVKRADGSRNGRVPEHLKIDLRRSFKVMKEAETAEIVGIHAINIQGQHGLSANQCYIGGGSSWGGFYWQYSLLFRWTSEEGNEMFVMSECPIAMEQNLTK